MNAAATLGLLCEVLPIIATSGTDRLSELYRDYLDWIWGMAPAHFWFFIRGLAALGISASLCWLAFFRFNSRLSAIQFGACLLGLLATMELPLESLALGRTAKGWLFSFSVLGLLTLPSALAWLLVRKEGPRKLVAAAIYLSLIVLFCFDLWRK